MEDKINELSNEIFGLMQANGLYLEEALRVLKVVEILVKSNAKI